MKLKKIVFPILFGLGVYIAGGCTQHPQTTLKPDPLTELVQNLDNVFSDPAFYNAHWGVAIQSLETGEIIFQRNARKGFMPASNMKLFTTAAALIKLGPDFQLQTEVYATGEIDDQGVLKGDLVVRGMADPALSGRYYDGNMTWVFQTWADSLKKAGIRKIQGRIIGDDTYFDDELLGEAWSWDYQSDYYAAQISALTFNDNCVDIIFTPGDSVGDSTSFRLQPRTDYITLENRVKTADKVQGTRIRLDRQQGGNHVVCTGSLYKKEEKQTEWVTVENPTRYTVVVLRSVLEENGITSGEVFDIDELPGFEYDKSQRVAIHYAPPMHEIIKTVNKVSQNLFAELLLRVVGKEYAGKGSADAGEQVAKELFSGMGINPEEIFMADGSGLTRVDMVSPQSVITLLRTMRQHTYGNYYYDSLPIAGVDGTISKRMQGTAAEDNVHAKTGYINRVRALSGYVTTRDGEELVFSMIVNNYTVPTSLCNAKQDLVCEWLANFSR
jgi:serine-type D-Ala-D-Ala carboxypeptidase/endopeptidase (penicillin-binding protein 4)